MKIARFILLAVTDSPVSKHYLSLTSNDGLRVGEVARPNDADFFGVSLGVYAMKIQLDKKVVH